MVFRAAKRQHFPSRQSAAALRLEPVFLPQPDSTNTQLLLSLLEVSTSELNSVKVMNAVEILNDKLRGTFIHSFQVGDSWVLNFGGYLLSAQNLISQDEGMLNEWLRANYSSFQNAVDKEFISKSAIVAAHLRKEVTSLKLDSAYNLTICFENDSEIVIPTNEEIVDWQWCLNKTGKDPYQDYIVACFWEGEIAVNEEASRVE